MVSMGDILTFSVKYLRSFTEIDIRKEIFIKGLG